MGEVDSSWAGWQLNTRPERLFERIAEPAGGLALVETGVDIEPALQSIKQQADNLIGPTRSEATVTWGHWKDADESGKQIYGPAIRLLLGDQVTLLDDVLNVTTELLDPIKEKFKPNLPPHCSTSSGGLLVTAARRIQLTPSHNDFDVVTMWLGSTNPALKVLNGEEWLQVDTVPPGHVLVWRGALAHTDEKVQLKPTNHYARYRSVIRRITMLAV